MTKIKKNVKQSGGLRKKLKFKKTKKKFSFDFNYNAKF